MQTMGVLILLFAISIGTATFIENDFGTIASKAVVYNATWFNILLLLLAINLIGRMIIGKMFRLKKITILTFHIAFLVILLGAAITRFISYEGMMHIRENGISNTLLSDNTYVDIEITKGNMTSSSDTKVFLSNITPHTFSKTMRLNDTKYKFKSIRYIPNASEVVTSSDKDGGVPYIVMVLSDGTGRRDSYLKYGESKWLGRKKINFSNDSVPGAINIKIIDGNLNIFADDTIISLSMSTSQTDTLDLKQWHSFDTRKLYSIDDVDIVLTNYYPNGVIDYVSNNSKSNMMNALIIEVTDGTSTKNVVVRGGKGYKGNVNSFTMDGVHINMTYGAKEIKIPFSIALKDFQLERYPGSMSPSSYASEVELIDDQKDVNFDYRIYMNHVLNYDGYRFFQSSYDTDEQGTILSVSHDYWGAFFTYLGYFLMSLGMLLSIFSKNTRFHALGKVIKNANKKAKLLKSTVVIAAMLVSSIATAQYAHNTAADIPEISEQLASDFGQLLVQSHDGRLKPVNSVASELLRKVARKSSFDGLDPDQVFLGMMCYPNQWQKVPIIKVTHPKVKEVLGIDGKYASYMDFITHEGTYKLSQLISDAYAKSPAKRNKFDKDIMKVDERLNICYMVYNGDMLNILPNPVNSHAPWFSTSSKISGMPQTDSAFLKSIIPTFLSAVASGNSNQAKQLLKGISDYQKKYGALIWPSENKIKIETFYNKISIFNNLSVIYGILGFLMIVLLFVEMFKPSKALKYVLNFFIVLIVLGFVAQTLGLAMRWYISEHAPWTNGYESMIYIAWVTLLAGLIFSSGSKMTIAATTILSSIILMVAYLSWMDPEITNLVPVLKSYWLTIHVSVITASYGFLALSAILGFINLIMMIVKSSKNSKILNLKIQELTAINKRSVTIGLFLLTIGTFLGGVWANESWGRYWGWDPKETWALVSVLVYAFIAHMNFMPGLKSKFSFNFATLISYSVILMTYLGVNYYLSGMHSYASGDPVPIPNSVYYALATVAVVAIWAYTKENRPKVDS